MIDPGQVGGAGGPGRVEVGRVQARAAQYDVTISAPTPGDRDISAVQGQSFSCDAAGARGAMQALARGLGDIPNRFGTGQLTLTLTIGPDGNVSSVRSDAFDEEHGVSTFSPRSGTTFRQLADAIAGSAAGLHFEPPADGQPFVIQVPLNFRLGR